MGNLDEASVSRALGVAFDRWDKKDASDVEHLSCLNDLKSLIDSQKLHFKITKKVTAPRIKNVVPDNNICIFVFKNTKRCPDTRSGPKYCKRHHDEEASCTYPLKQVVRTRDLKFFLFLTYIYLRTLVCICLSFALCKCPTDRGRCCGANR